MMSVQELIDLLGHGNTTVACDAIETLVPMIIESAAAFYTALLDDDGDLSLCDWERYDALEIAEAFVKHRRDVWKEQPTEVTDCLAAHMVYLAGQMLKYGGMYHLSDETRAQLERIANSGESDQPSEPTEPDLQPGRLRSSGNGGQGVEVRHG
jgi:hypothetical protein